MGSVQIGGNAGRGKMGIKCGGWVRVRVIPEEEEEEEKGFSC